MTAFKIKGPNLPIINDGTQHFTIVTDDHKETVVCMHRFLAPDYRHPKYEDYMEDQRRVARALLKMVERSEVSDLIVDYLSDIQSKYLDKK